MNRGCTLELAFTSATTLKIVAACRSSCQVTDFSLRGRSMTIGRHSYFSLPSLAVTSLIPHIRLSADSEAARIVDSIHLLGAQGLEQAGERSRHRGDLHLEQTHGRVATGERCVLEAIEHRVLDQDRMVSPDMEAEVFEGRSEHELGVNRVDVSKERQHGALGDCIFIVLVHTRGQ